MVLQNLTEGILGFYIRFCRRFYRRRVGFYRSLPHIPPLKFGPRFVRDGEEILLLFLPQRSTFRNIDGDSGAKQSRGRVRGGGLLVAPFPAGLLSLVAEEQVTLKLII